MNIDFSSNYLYILLAAAVVVIFIVGQIIWRRRRSPAKAQDPYIEALKKLIDREPKAAYTLLQKAVKRGGAPTDAYIKLGELLRTGGEAGKALQIHQSLTVKTNLSKDEKTSLFKNIAQDYASLGKPQQAVAVLESAIKSSHLREPDLLNLLARQYHQLGQMDRSFETLRELKRFDQIGDRELALFLASAGEKSLAAGDDKTARKYLQKALKHDSSCPTALYLLGGLEENNGRGDGAIQYWKEAALSSEELAGPALESLQKILFNEGRFGDLEQINLDILARRPGDETARLALAQFYQKQGREDDALQLLEDYEAGPRGSLGIAVLLTSIYARREDSDTLESFINRATARDGSAQEYLCANCNHREPLMHWHCPECNSFDSFNSAYAE